MNVAVRILIIAYLLAALGVCSAAAAPAPVVTGQVVAFPSDGKTLHGWLYQPRGAGPFPVLLYNHGSAPGLLSNEAFENIAPILLTHGWALFAPYRRGQGLSSDAGPYIGDEIDKAKANGGLAAAARRMVRLLSTDQLRDQMAALMWLKSQPFVKASRVAVMGNSFGGIETVFGAAAGGYCAAVDVAGGAESWDIAPTLREAMRDAVRKSKVPIFFLQAQNDYNVAPSRALYEAMRAAGAAAQLKIFAAYGSSVADGHSFAYRGTAIWKDDVLEFLDRNCK
jgi:carboxymethylenebutenolidase